MTIASHINIPHELYTQRMCSQLKMINSYKQRIYEYIVYKIYTENTIDFK